MDRAVSDWTAEQIIVRVLDPACEHLDRLYASLEGIEDADEAWEVCATRGFIPDRWMEQGSRRFIEITLGVGASDARDGDEGGSSRWEHVSQQPLFVEDVVTLACDARGIEAAEELAREFARRLRDWGATIGDDVNWSFTDGHYLEINIPCMDLISLALPSDVRIEARQSERVRRLLSEGPTMWMYRTIWGDIERAGWWERAALLGRHVQVHGSTRAMGIPTDLRGRSFADIASPLAPLLSIYQMGYLVHEVRPDGVLLAAPRRDRSRLSVDRST